MEDNKKVIAIFSDTITDNALLDIERKHKDLIHDFTNEEEFKAARKVNSEMNALIKKVDRIGVDAAKQVTNVRNSLKDKIESAYSGTVTPFKIEDQKRKDEKKRIEDEKKARVAEQQEQINMMKGAAARAIHLTEDEVSDILQDVMDVDIDSFDDDIKDDAKISKDIAIAQLGDAFRYISEKEEARKEKEIKDAEIADKDDEIARLMAMLEAQKPVEVIEHKEKTISEKIKDWCDSSDLGADCHFELMTIINNHFNMSEK